MPDMEAKSATQQASTLTLSTSPPVTLLAGTIIDGSYQVVRLLGRGGMGAVYLVEDVFLRQIFALKILARTDSATDAITQQRFEREARLMAGLEAEHFVPVVRYGLDPATGLPYYVMKAILLDRAGKQRICTDVLKCPLPPELMEGSDTMTQLTLGDFLQHERVLPERAVVFVAEQIVLAIQALHAMVPQIIHRDIKPSNILFDAEGNVLLSDFGIAKTVTLNPEMAESTLTLPEQFLGTPVFASPEQRNGGIITAASDYYSLGLVLYRALSGAFPGTGSSELPRETRKTVSHLWGRLLEELLQRDVINRLVEPKATLAWLKRIRRDQMRRRCAARMIRVAAVLIIAGGFFGSLVSVYNLLISRLTQEKPEPQSASVVTQKTPREVGIENRKFAEKNLNPDKAAIINSSEGDPLHNELIFKPELVTIDGESFLQVREGETLELQYFDMQGKPIYLNGGTLIFGKRISNENDLENQPNVQVEDRILLGPKGGKMTLHPGNKIYLTGRVEAENGTRPKLELQTVGFEINFDKNTLSPNIVVEGVYRTAEYPETIPVNGFVRGTSIVWHEPNESIPTSPAPVR